MPQYVCTKCGYCGQLLIHPGCNYHGAIVHSEQEYSDLLQSHHSLCGEVAQLKADKEALIEQRDKAYSEKDKTLLQIDELKKDSKLFQNMAGVFGKELLDLKVVLKKLHTYLPTLILNPEARYELAIPAPIVAALRETINGTLEADSAVARLLARLDKESKSLKRKSDPEGGDDTNRGLGNYPSAPVIKRNCVCGHTWEDHEDPGGECVHARVHGGVKGAYCPCGRFQT